MFSSAKEVREAIAARKKELEMLEELMQFENDNCSLWNGDHSLYEMFLMQERRAETIKDTIEVCKPLVAKLQADEDRYFDLLGKISELKEETEEKKTLCREHTSCETQILTTYRLLWAMLMV